MYKNTTMILISPSENPSSLSVFFIFFTSHSPSLSFSLALCFFLQLFPLISFFREKAFGRHQRGVRPGGALPVGPATAAAAARPCLHERRGAGDGS